jgi:hypothetical protein
MQATGRPSRSAAGHNVLLITLDTTRADRLGCYGYSQPRTPRLDGLARALTERPALTIEIAGYADDTADRRALEQRQVEQMLRTAKLSQMKRENPRADLPAARGLLREVIRVAMPGVAERAVGSGWRGQLLSQCCCRACKILPCARRIRPCSSLSSCASPSVQPRARRLL